MIVDLDKKDLAKYPFLKEAQELISSRAYSLDQLIQSSSGALISRKAAKRVIDAVSQNLYYDEIGLDFPEGEILSYALARVIVSCMDDRMVMDRLTKYESARAFHFLLNEDPKKKEYIATNLGINLDSDEISLKDYVELGSSLRDSRWRLVNRNVRHGMVAVTRGESEELLRERIRIILRRNLPLQIPEVICEKMKLVIDKVNAAYQQKILEDFGQVEEGSFPPCMQALIEAISKGTNIPHTGRFALTAFLHTIGMNPVQIVEVFTRAPDFDVSRTMYQVEHISGGGGTEYTPPACATMRTYGLCIKRDKLCERLNHPLSYYKLKKKSKQN
jgi:DNA primase large subunit